MAPISFPPTTQLSHADQGSEILWVFVFFCAYGKHDEWIALVVASSQVCMISSETSQVVGPADLDPSSAADCFAYIHPELRVDALTSQAAGNEHSLITVT